MAASFVLSLREGLEAALIIGIVLGVLNKMHRPELKPVVWGGTILAVVVSVAAALILNVLGMEFEGMGEQVFEGSTMLLAAGILTWMIFWMQRQGGALKSEIEVKTGAALLEKGQHSLFLLAFLAVVREGVELALFLVAARLSSSPLQTLAGTALGLSGSVILGWILFSSTRRLSLKSFFQTTNALLILFAAGLVGLGVHEFNEAGLIPVMIGHVWDISQIMNDEMGIGSILKALFGYNEAPSLSMVIAYLAYFGVILLGLYMTEKMKLGAVRLLSKFWKPIP